MWFGSCPACLRGGRHRRITEIDPEEETLRVSVRCGDCGCTFEVEGPDAESAQG